MMGMSYNEITLALQLENKSVDNAVQRIRKKVNKSKTLNLCAEGV
jgi:DNA-binding NarL/FixJ family response regulator